MNISTRMKRIQASLKQPRMYSTLATQIFKYVLLIGISFIILFPFFVKVSSSLMSLKDLSDKTVKYIPRNPTFDNLIYVITQSNYFKALWNTLWISSLTAVIQISVCTCVSYGFARFRFKGRGILFALVMLTMIVPRQTTIVSYFMTFRYFDPFRMMTLLIGQPLSLVGSPIPVFLQSLCGLGLKSALYIYVLRQYFIGLPIELNEAAGVDGAGVLRTFWKIMVPLARPMMITVFLLAFSWQWTDSYYASLFFNDYSILPNVLNQVAILGADSYGGSLQSSVYVNCAALLIILPLLILYICTQKWLIGGIERSGLVG